MSVNPNTLSLPTPSSSTQMASSEPKPSSQPRKRARTDASPEERKEARAHRNRIAAQNSRDRRKAHYATLERRIQDLEQENAQLRNGVHSDAERENAELRERVRTLETGWQTVLTALAAQGLPIPNLGGEAPSPATVPANAPSPASSDPSVQSVANTLLPSPALSSTLHLSPLSQDHTVVDSPSPLSFNASPLQLEHALPTTDGEHCPFGGAPAAGSSDSDADNSALFSNTTNADKVLDTLFHEIIVPCPEETSGLAVVQDTSGQGQAQESAALCDAEMTTASILDDLLAANQDLSTKDQQSGEMNFEIPLDFEFDWINFDPKLAETTQSNLFSQDDTQQNLVDSFAWNLVQV